MVVCRERMMRGMHTLTLTPHYLINKKKSLVCVLVLNCAQTKIILGATFQGI